MRPLVRSHRFVALLNLSIPRGTVGAQRSFFQVKLGYIYIVARIDMSFGKPKERKSLIVAREVTVRPVSTFSVPALTSMSDANIRIHESDMYHCSWRTLWIFYCF